MSKNSKIIITSSDSNYFNLSLELFNSVKNNDLLKDFDFGILDTGLSELNLEILNSQQVIVKKAEWNSTYSNFKVRGRNHLKTQYARAFLPDYFQNYKVYIWLDADTWINHKETFLLYEKGCKMNKLCITPQTDRAYGSFAKVNWFAGFPTKIKTINYKNISKSVSTSLGRKYALHPTLNAGAFSINDNYDLWKIFQKNIHLASKKGRIFGTDQVALALSIYEDNLPVEFLPAYSNWMCEFHLPMIDDGNSIFIEPYLPNHPIGLIHLAGLDNIRKDKNVLSNIKDLKGFTHQKSLRYNIKN